MDPLTGLAIAGGLTMLYNTGNYAYEYFYPKDFDSMTYEDIKKIEKEMIEESTNKVLKQVEKIKVEHDIDWVDVVSELESLFKYKNIQSSDSSESSYSEDSEDSEDNKYVSDTSSDE